MPSLLTHPQSKVLRNLYKVEALIFLYCACRISEVVLINQQVNSCFAFPQDQCLCTVHRQCCITALARNVSSLTFSCSCSGWALSLCQASTRMDSPLALTCTLGQNIHNCSPEGSSDIVTCSDPAPAWVLRLCCLDKYRSRWKWWVNCYRLPHLFVKQDNIYCLLFTFFLISSQSKHPLSFS